MLKCNSCSEASNPYSGFEMLAISKPDQPPCGKCTYSKSLRFRFEFLLWKLKQMVLGCSWVRSLNVWIFQWLFFRIGYRTLDRSWYAYVILFPVIPLTGWWNDYKPQNRFCFTIYKGLN